MSELVSTGGQSPFDRIKQTRPDGSEFWSARSLQGLMGYARWENLAPAIARAQQAASNTGADVTSLFLGSQEKVTGGRPREDFHLSRYAAYLVAMNGDPTKPEVAAAQSYFAVKTREAEARPELSRREILRMALEAEDRADAAEAKAAVLEPAARSWEQLSEAVGDYSVREAAQILNRDPSISTGQQRLFAYLRTIGWLGLRDVPYQSVIELGRLTVRTSFYEHPVTAEKVATSQTRVTVKGLGELHKRLGGAGPLLLSA